MAQSRSYIREMFKNFINSLKPRQLWGVKVGQDHFGTTYYEIPEDLRQGSMRRRSRWFEPPKGSDFQQEIPAEWMSWLRNRRKHPPTDEEIQINMAKARAAIEGARKAEIDFQISASEKNQETKTIEKVPFPTYDGYELQPGSKPPKN